SVMRRVAKPYVVAYVTLDEGPTVMTNIATPDIDAVRIGQRVRVMFEDTNTGFKLPVFAPV
ncbi:MAG: OB-fold domain-containing protein, partial [Pseudolabrys sp.]|nr:OB-fold domain-containing protein [Pseudolabrys sp.]